MERFGKFHKRLLAGTALVLVVLAGIWMLYGGPGRWGGPNLTPADESPGITEWQFPIPSFELTDQLSQPVASEQLKGKVLVADFIYTHCEAECPLMTAFMGSLQRSLVEEGLLGSEVVLLSFTTDPLRDSPEVLRAYGEQFRADPNGWRFLTGPARYLVDLIEDGFHLPVGYTDLEGKSVDPFSEELEQYEVAHSLSFLLIDRDGEVQRVYRFPDFDLSVLLDDVKALAAVR